MEKSSNYIMDYYLGHNIKPTVKFLKDERTRRERWLYKDNEFLGNLIIAIRYLSFITIDVFLEDYELC